MTEASAVRFVIARDAGQAILRATSAAYSRTGCDEAHAVLAEYRRQGRNTECHLYEVCMEATEVSL